MPQQYDYTKLPDYVKDLPYQLPKDTQAATNKLAEIIGINKLWVRNADIKILELLAGFILYKHLGRFEKHKIMQDVLSYKSSRPELSMELQSKVADTLVNPNWDPWSQSTKQLQETIANDKEQDKYLSWLGFLGYGVTAKSVPEWYKVFKTGSGANKLGILGIAISILSTGLQQLNAIEEEKLTTELNRRTPKARSSSVY